MKRTVLAAVALFAVLCTASAQAGIQSKFGITIGSCVVNANGSGGTNGVNIVYYNTHPSAANEVDFLVGYRGHKFVMVDRGTFSQGAQINHNLTNALVGYTWDGPNPNMCTVQRVFLNNGRVLGP